MKPPLILTLLLLAAINLQAQQPIIKFYLADGTSKQYKLADIDSLTFSNKTEKSQMQIFYSQTKTAYYPPYLIDKIRVGNGVCYIENIS
ncbi:MAG: hypothetical protein NT007_05005 [Candidatus Kapabacteria bacterium]|nr:hypothetical protein [Candidatus Kapabacteria bacterium]